MTGWSQVLPVVAGVLLSLPSHAQLPPPMQGGAYAVYENISRGNRFFVGFDTATEMVLFQRPVHGPAWYHRNGQEPLAFNPGESAALRDYKPAHAIEMLSLTEYFPSLAAHILANADPELFQSRRLNDGGWEVQTSIAFSNLWAYHKDPDDPRLQDVVPATFVFDADGILRRVKSGTQGNETDAMIDYHDAVEHPRLAPKLVHPQDWRIIEAKTWVDDVPEEISDLESVFTFAQTQAFAEAEAFRTLLEASLASEEGTREIEQSNQQLLEPVNESSPRRWAVPIMFVGVVFLSISGFAWWKQR